MKQCLDCVHAQWKRTANGRMHPSGDGKCAHPYTVRENVQAIVPATVRIGFGFGGPWICRHDSDRRVCRCKETIE